MSELRVLLLTSCADPIGGAERYVYQVRNALRARGFATLVFGTSPERDVDDADLRVVRRAPFIPEELFGDEPVTDALDATLRRFRPDVVHVHNLYGLPLTVDARLAEEPAAVMQTVHDYSTLCPNSWCVRGDGTPCPGGAGDQCFRYACGDNYPYTTEIVLYTKLRQALLQRALDVALAPSRALVERMHENGFPDVRHLPYFIEPRDAGDEVSPDAFDPDLVLFVGRLDSTKGVRYLVDAMPHVLAKRPTARLSIVGTGPEHEALEAQVAARSLQGSVTFHGGLGYDDVAAFMGRAAGIVVPSIWSENSPLTLYECMDAGLPAIGSRIGGIPDLVLDGETGYLAEPRDPEDLGRKISALLAGPAKRREMARRQRDRVREFGREANMDRLIAVYEEISRRHGNGPRHGGVDRDLLSIVRRVCAAPPAPADPPAGDAPAGAATPDTAEKGLRAFAKRLLTGRRSDP